jgi:hypothetical protein
MADLKKYRNIIIKIITFLSASGILAVLLTVFIDNRKQKNLSVDNVSIVISSPFFSEDGINLQRIYIINNSKTNIENAKLLIKIPDINGSNFRFNLSQHLEIQKKDASVTDQACIFLFERIIGKNNDPRDYYIDLKWKGKAIDSNSITFDSNNCHESKKKSLNEVLNNY